MSIIIKNLFLYFYCLIFPLVQNWVPSTIIQEISDRVNSTETLGFSAGAVEHIVDDNNIRIAPIESSSESDLAKRVLIFKKNGSIDTERMAELREGPRFQDQISEEETGCKYIREDEFNSLKGTNLLSPPNCHDEIAKFRDICPPRTETMESRIKSARSLWLVAAFSDNPVCIEEIRNACHEYCMVGTDRADIHLFCITRSCLYYIIE